LLPDGFIDPILDAACVQAIVVVLTAAVTATIAHVGNQFVVTASLVWMVVQEDCTT
jgi:hypothetical protein